MGRSVTVLKWADIHILVKICAHSIPTLDEGHQHLEAVRQNLVEAFLSFFQQWQPEQEMDDELRRPLVESLDEFAELLRKAKGFNWPKEVDEQSSLSTNEVRKQCSRISKLIRSAMSKTNGDDEPPSSRPGTIAGFLICLAAQGQLLSIWFGQTPLGLEGI